MDIREFREVENRPDVVYDPTRKTRVYAEDIVNTQEAVLETQYFVGEGADLGMGTVEEAMYHVDAQGYDAYNLADEANAEAMNANNYANDAYNLADEANSTAGWLEQQVYWNTNAIDEIYAHLGM